MGRHWRLKALVREKFGDGIISHQLQTGHPGRCGPGRRPPHGHPPRLQVPSEQTVLTASHVGQRPHEMCGAARLLTRGQRAVFLRYSIGEGNLWLRRILLCPRRALPQRCFGVPFTFWRNPKEQLGSTRLACVPGSSDWTRLSPSKITASPASAKCSRHWTRSSNLRKVIRTIWRD